MLTKDKFLSCLNFFYKFKHFQVSGTEVESVPSGTLQWSLKVRMAIVRPEKFERTAPRIFLIFCMVSDIEKLCNVTGPDF